MRGLVLLLGIVALIVSFSLIIGNINGEKIEDKEQPKISKFSIFTSAVCENREDLVHCRDEIYVNCSGKISKADDVAECGGVKIDVPRTTGFAVFGNDWKDPRN